MKKLLNVLLIPVFAFIMPVRARAAPENAVSESVDVESVENAVPDSAQEIIGNSDTEDTEIFSKIWGYVRENGGKEVRRALSGASKVLCVAVLCAFGCALFEDKAKYMITASVCAVAAITVSDAASFLTTGRETINELSAFSKILLPTLASSAALSGAYTSAAAKCAVSSFFIDILITLGAKFAVPVILAYLAACIGNAATTGGGLSAVTGLLKWVSVTFLTGLVIVFTCFLSITGIVSGTADAAASRIAKTAISTALPVVGGVISDAAGAVAAGAGTVKNTIGVFGMAVTLAVIAVPFLRIGAAYLAYKAAAGLSACISDTRISGLLSNIGTAFGMVLGLIGACAVMLFISVIIAMKGVT